jgi:serine/threonine protein kinase
VVYRAFHLVLRQPVAIKCFLSLATDDDGRAEHLDRFAREGALLTALSSRTVSIVQARDMGVLSTDQHASVPYLVLEWLEGRSLEAVLHKYGTNAPKLSLEALFGLFDGVCRALALAHSVGVAHRDIKPGNIYVLGGELTPHAPLKLLDFGIAKVMDMAAPEMTSATTGGVFSPQYAAPEQYNRGLGATGPWTDVYAICLVLLELMRGGMRVYPQRELQAIAMACLDANNRPTPRALGLQVSDEVEAVFARATAMAIADRYQDMGSFWIDLADALGVQNVAPIARLNAAELSLPARASARGRA